MKKCLVMILLTAMFSVPSLPADADFSGTWKGKTNIPSAGADELTLVLKKAQDSYTGTLVDTLQIIASDTPIRDVTIEDDSITFLCPLVDGTIITCRLILDGEWMKGDWTHQSGSRGMIRFEKKRIIPDRMGKALSGEYQFVLEEEKMHIKISFRDGILYGKGEYSLGELKPVSGEALKFTVKTEHGENWSLEFIKNDRGDIVKCRLTDHDFPELESLTGMKIIRRTAVNELIHQEARRCT